MSVPSLLFVVIFAIRHSETSLVNVLHCCGTRDLIRHCLAFLSNAYKPNGVRILVYLVY